MSKQKQNKNKLFRGMSGSEIKYIEQAIKYGHLPDYRRSKGGRK